MASTIEVAEDTLADLQSLKQRLGLPTYDAVLQRLLAAHRERSAPPVGIAPGLAPFVREHGECD